MLAGRRQLSLDETGRRRLKRQSSEIRPIIAWQESFRDSVEKQQSQVEVVAKKIGQPKPTPTRPLKSPVIRNESCLTLSRRQVAERLKIGWNKATAKEGQDKGRQNINIFLNKSFEARPESPRTPELGNGFRRSQSLYNPNEEDCNSDTSTDSESDDDNDTGIKETVARSVSLQKEPPACTQQQTAPQQPQRERTSTPQQQQQREGTGPPQQQRQLSASARRAAFKAVGRQQQTATSSPEPRPRLMSAPPQPARPPLTERSRSAPPRRRQQRRPRRGVEGGEVVTMVSLVSPAESEDEELLPHGVHCPPTPEAPPTPPAVSPPPAPILSFRRPPKSVTFTSSMGDGPQFRTSYPSKSPIILQGDKETAEVTAKVESTRAPVPPVVKQSVRSLVQKMGKAQNALPSKPKTSVLQRQASKPEAQGRPEDIKKKSIVTNIPEPIQEETLVEDNEKIQLKETEEILSLTEQVEEEAVKEESPDFKSAKERECWQLFKRMSSRGVSVSFETVLRWISNSPKKDIRKVSVLLKSNGIKYTDRHHEIDINPLNSLPLLAPGVIPVMTTTYFYAIVPGVYEHEDK